LAQAQAQAESTCVCSKDLANIHPQDRRQSRILTLRVIIRGSGARSSPMPSGLRLDRAGGLN
jgi:hypothetical protein